MDEFRNQEHMPVISRDGKHVCTLDRIEGGGQRR